MEDCTQVLDTSTTGFDISDIGRLKVGTLVINGASYDIFRGENVIGRDELSDIVIRSNAISTKHAVVEVENWEAHMIYDCGSTNKTKLGKLLLKPNVRYQLQGNDDIMFADLKAKYIKLDKPQTLQNDDDSVSETDSESMLNCVSVDQGADPSDEENNQSVKSPAASEGRAYCNGDESKNTSNTLTDLNDSSLLEQTKQKITTSKIQVIDASDDSTEDEAEFIPPSQTVKEFAANTQGTSSSLRSQAKPQSMFGANDISKNSMDRNSENTKGDVDNDLCNMTTEDQQMMFMTGNTSCIKVGSLDLNSQNLFDSQVFVFVKPKAKRVIDATIFEAETQQILNFDVQTHKDEGSEEKSRPSRDIFDAETEVPEFASCKDSDLDNTGDVSKNQTTDNSERLKEHVLDDVEMSDLVLSHTLTEPNTSLQSLKSSAKTVSKKPEEKKEILDVENTNALKNNIDYTAPEENHSNSNKQSSTQLNTSVLCKSMKENNNQIEEESGEPSDIEHRNCEINNVVNNFESDGIDILDALTQVNTSLISKQKLFGDSNGISCDEDIYDALTQVNTSLNPRQPTTALDSRLEQSSDQNDNYYNALTQVSNVKPKLQSKKSWKSTATPESGTDNEPKKDIVGKDEIEEGVDFAAEETQLNIDLLEEKRRNAKTKMRRINYKKFEADILNIEAEETQPNLNLHSFFSESEVKPADNAEIDITDLLTQPNRLLRKSAEDEDSDNTDVEDDGKPLTGGYDERNYVEFQKQSNSKDDVLTKCKTSMITSEHKFDDSSNESDSVLASMDMETILNEGEQTVTKEKCEKEIESKGEASHGVSREKSDKVLKQIEDKCDETLRKTYQDTTCQSDMEICSTVGDVAVSACGSTNKNQTKLDPETKKPLPQSSCKKLQQITPITEEQTNKLKSRRSKNLFGAQVTALDTLNQSTFLNEPCGSSTPFRPEDRVVPSAGKLAKEIIKTPTKKIQVIMAESPELPCTEELLAVASVTPGRNNIDVKKSSKGERDKLPLAMKRTPRAKKLSRKMAETLETGGIDTFSHHLDLMLNNRPIEQNKSVDSNEEESIQTSNSKKAPKRKPKFDKKDLTDVETEKSRDDCHEERSKHSKLAKDTNIEIDINEVTPPKKSSRLKRTSEILEEERTQDVKNIDSVTVEEVSHEIATNFEFDKLQLKINRVKTVSVKVKDISKPSKQNKSKKSPDAGEFSDQQTRIQSPIKKTKNNKDEQTNRGCSKEESESVVVSKRATRQKKHLDRSEKKVVEAEETVEKLDVMSNKRKEQSSSSKLIDESVNSSAKRQGEGTSRVKTSIKDCVINVDSSAIAQYEESLSSNYREKRHVQSKKIVTADDSQPSPSKKSKLSGEEAQGKISVGDNLQNKKRSMKTNKESDCLTPSKAYKHIDDIKTDTVETIRSRGRKRNQRKEGETSDIKEPTEPLESPRKSSKSSNNDNVCANTLESTKSPKRSRTSESPQKESKVEKSKEENRVNAKEQIKTNKKDKPVAVECHSTDTYNMIANATIRRQSKRGKNDRKANTSSGMAKDINSSKTESLVVNENTANKVILLEINTRNTRRTRKENITKSNSKEKINDSKMENKSLNEIKQPSEPRKKRKLKDSITGETIKTKMSILNSERNVNDDLTTESSNLVGDNGDNHEKSGRGGNSTRSRVKPARLRNSEVIEMSNLLTNEKTTLSLKTLKPRETVNNMESVNSITLVEENTRSNNNNSFIVPTKSNSRKNKKQKESINEERSRPSSVDNDKSRSRSRSGSISSQSSLKSQPSSIQSPRRSVTKRNNVLFSSGLSNPTLESQIKKLGGLVVDCPLDCSVLVTDKVRRTVKFLCVLGQGKPIVSPNWIVQSWRCTLFEDPIEYLLMDREAEDKFKFSLSKTLQLARKQPLLRGFNVHATPSVKPPPEDIKSIVECCGGQYLEKVPSKWPENSVIVSHEDDKNLWKKFKVKGMTPPIVAAEMLLIGILQHKIEVDIHRIL